MRMLIACLVSVLLPALASGQSAAVYGTITAGGEAIPQAHVVAEGHPHLGTTADLDGHYRMEDVAPGAYTFRASAVGYGAVEQTVALAAGEQRRLDFVLEQAVLQGEEVVVTATMEETYVKDSPVRVDVLSARYFQRTTTDNLMDVIGTVNGLDQQLNCGVCYTNAIRINGVEGKHTAVLLDGMPLMGALASVYGLNGINPALIDRVEVIKGPQSTLYGTEALAGVVNVITKRPETTPTLSASAYVKSTQETSLDVALAPETGRFQTLVGVMGTRMEHFFDENDDGFADQARVSRLSVFGKGTLPGTLGQPVVEVSGKYYGENRTGGVEAFSDDLRGSGTVYGESIYTHRLEWTGAYRPQRLRGRMQVQGAYTYHDQDSYYGDERYAARQQIAFGQATYRQPLGDDSDVLWGATLRYETYDDNTPATATADRRAIPGVFAQADAEWGALRWLGGLRLDHHAEHGVIAAPRLSVKYSPSDYTTVRLNSGTGFRVVHVFTEDHAALTGARDVVFTEDLDPERSYNVTASIQHIFPFGTHPLTLDVDGFYTRFSNQILPDYDQDPDLIVYGNLDGHSVSRGVAVGVSQNFTALPLRYRAGLTLLDVYAEDGGERRAVAYAPAYDGTLNVSYHLHALELDLDYTMTLTGPKRMPDAYVQLGRAGTSPAFTVHDLRVSRELLRPTRGTLGTEVTFTVENLFGYTQGSPLVAPSDPFGEDFDTVYTYGPLVGRTVALGLRVTVP